MTETPDRVSVDRFVVVPLSGAPYPPTFLDAINGFATGGSTRCREAIMEEGAWLDALSAAPRPTGEAVAWRGQTDGIDECTVRPETRDDWTRYGRKITPLYAIPPAPSADSGGELREPARDDPFWTALEAFMFRHGVMAAVEIADVDALRAEALAQPAPHKGEG